MQKVTHYFENSKVLSVLINRELFIRIYIISSILWFFPALGIFVDPICKVCFIWGAFLIGYDILTKRVVLRASYWYWAVALLGMYCVTILINIQSNFYMGIKHLIYSALSLMIVFVQNGHMIYEKEKQLLKWVNSVVIFVVFCSSLISLFMYCFHISIYFEQNGITFRQGFLENRLFGVYTSPNVGALFSIICIAAIMINSYLEKGSLIKWKKRYIVCGIMQILYFSLTLSNGGFLTACVFILLLVCVLCFMKLRQKIKIVKAVFISVIIAAVAMIGLNLAIQGIRIAMSAVPSTFQYIREKIEESDDEEENIDKIVFDRIESGDDASNGRLAIWSGSIKIWAQSPIFGIADARIDGENLNEFAYSLDSLNDVELQKIISVDGNLHNAYVEILTDSGAAGFFCFLVLIILIVKRYIKYLLSEDIDSDSYKIVGVLFCVLGAIGANGMVENHLLFNRQDPYGILFWFYLGSGLILIKNAISGTRFKDHVCKEQVEKNLFYCDTPLQLFNSINFVINNQMDSRGKSDLVVVHQFRDSQNIVDRIREKKIFNNVYDAYALEKKSGIYSKLSTLFRVLFPRKTVRKCLKSEWQHMKYHYRYYFLSFLTPASISLQLSNPCADVMLMEDGLGTYIGDIEADFTSSLCKSINKYFLDNRMSLNPKAIILNNPQICHSSINSEFIKLPDLDRNSECIKILQYIFDYKDDERDLKDIIYMTQPLADLRDCIPEAEQRLMYVLQEIAEQKNVEIRVHPRQKDFDTMGLPVSDNSKMWELECINHINNNHILISAYSTALFMPKILNNSEPTLIFVYKLLLSKEEQGKLAEMETFISDFAKEYKDPSRIYIPNSIEEFREILVKDKLCV